MFYQKGQGIPGFIRILPQEQLKNQTVMFVRYEKSPPRWSTGATVPQLQNAIGNGLGINSSGGNSFL